MPSGRRLRREAEASEVPGTPRYHDGTNEESDKEVIGDIPTTEMGYILLSPCHVFLSQSSNSIKIPTRKWIDVLMYDETKEEAAENDSENNSCTTCTCPHCNLVLLAEQSDLPNQTDSTAPETQAALKLNISNVGKFQAAVSDMIHSPAEQSHCRQKRRSDAALLIGAVLEAQEFEYISIQSFKILLHENSDSSRSCLASLLFTLSFPSLASSANIKQPTSIVPQSRRPRNGINHKPLPPSVQFLLSIIYSDWNQLDLRMKDLGNGDYQVATGTDFFPPKLSLEELYIRMHSTLSKCQSGRSEEEDCQDRVPKGKLHLLNLPIDILQTQIAPFLRAKSLDSLRCTCKNLHYNLQAVIPGLKLRLYKHQVTSLKWMRRREIEPISEARGHSLLLNSAQDSSGIDGDSDPIRAMTAGQSVWLCPRISSNQAPYQRTQGIRINQMTGNESNSMEAEQGFLARRGARGGLLCDDPGLGKTITVLALILASFGISTEANDKGQADKALQKIENLSPEEQIFRAYWKEEITPDFRRPALCRMMARVKKLDPTAGYFLSPIDPVRDGCEDYLEVVETPICLNDIYKKISAGAYGDGNSDFNAFVSDVELCFRNAMEYNPPDHSFHKAAKNLLKRFRDELLPEFKQYQLGSVRASISNTSLKPNSSVAVLMQQKSQHEFNNSLISSRTTLLVIPHVLMEHWEEQLKMHVNFRYCTTKIPLIYEYTPARKSALGTEEALRLCQVDKTHCPLVFLDKAGTHKLPSAEFLSMFSIVITTTKRFANEWKNGTFQEELQRKQAENENEDGDGKYLNYRLMEYGSSDEEACPLLKIHFLRLVVDEGHAMGRGKGSSSIRFASWISAQRRFAMTGTPTKQTVSQTGLNNMLGLMDFLQHDFFTARLDGDKVWKRHIAKSWVDGHLAAFFRLKSLLSLLMIRHTKLDIEELPPPIYKTTVIPMSAPQTLTYNTLVSAAQQNLLLTSFKGAKTSGEQDSLLHRSQSRYAHEVLTNIRYVCCGGSLVFPSITDKNWAEFFDLCMFKHHMNGDQIEKLTQYLNRATVEEQATACNCCGMLLSSLLVLPCACLLCTECMPNDTNVCLMCDKEFDVDDFQRLQPGLDFQWKGHDLALKEQEEFKNSDKGRPGAVANTEQGTHEPGPDEHNGDAVHNPDGGLDQILIRPPAERRRTRKHGDGHVCEYSRSFVPGKCHLCFDEHSSCKLINPQSCCDVCYKKAEDCPEHESKSYYLYQKLSRLYREQQKMDENYSPTKSFDDQSCQPFNQRRRFKCIVFSQFRKSLDVVGDRLLRGFGPAHVAEYWGTYRQSELHKFIHDPDCFVMLLGKDGSEGLDLSFVTDVIFLEALWDKSLEQQAVARAWRMGAKGSVEVETLLAKGSVEEQLWKLEEALNDETVSQVIDEGSAYSEDVKNMCVNSETASRAEYQRAKIHFCIKNLKLIPELELVPLPMPKAGTYSRKRTASVDALLPAKKKKTLEKKVRFLV